MELNEHDFDVLDKVLAFLISDLVIGDLTTEFEIVIKKLKRK